jgi:hypothetical protein
VKEEIYDIRVTRRRRIKRPRWEPEIEMFSEENVKAKNDSDNDLDTQTTVKLETPSTSKRGAATKGKRVKGVSVS